MRQHAVVTLTIEKLRLSGMSMVRLSDRRRAFGRPAGPGLIAATLKRCVIKQLAQAIACLEPSNSAMPDCRHTASRHNADRQHPNPYP